MQPELMLSLLRYIATGIICCIWTIRASAQVFQLMRYDEDYSSLKDSSGTFYNRIKYIPLTPGKNVYLSLGGDIRPEFDAFNNEDWGAFHAGKDNFLLQRYDLHADLHLGESLRFFVQLRSALENGRPHGPRPIDEDKGNVQNLFGDLRLKQSVRDTLTIRAGRQELNYGSGRLISVRDGPNLRLYFTGLKGFYRTRNLSLDAFAMESDSLRTGTFDNKGSKQINLWGVYSSLNLPALNHIDGYYVGIRNSGALYEEGRNNEQRNTIGARFWRSANGLNYDIEANYQFGRFGNGPIRAWAAFLDINYLFGDCKWTPVIGIRNDYTSGDRKPGDGKLGTYNPIYPKAGYFSGFDPQVGAANLIDLHPYASLLLFSKVSVNLDIAFNWRYSIADGVYRPNGVLNLDGAASSKKYIGTANLLKIVYFINPFININFGIQVFNTGPFVDSIVPDAKNALLTNTQISFKF